MLLPDPHPLAFGVEAFGVEASGVVAFGFVSWGFFFAGLLLTGIPILIHILNRRRFKTMTWAAMEFLLRAMRKNRRRLRFEQWLLLATRCLLLFLLGVALARPLGCETSAIGALGRHTSLTVFVIDNSYSMSFDARRPGARTHLDQAKRVAKALLDRAPAAGGTSVAVITAARPAVAVIARPAFDLEAAKSAIDRIEQSYAATDLAGAMGLALRLAKDEPNQPNKNLVLLTDATRSAWEGGDAPAIRQAAAELARHYKLTHYSMTEGRPQWNAAVFDVRPADNLVTNRFDTALLADVRAFGAAHETTLQWKLDDQPLDAPGGPVKPGPDRKDQVLPQVVFKTGGPHVIAVTAIDDDGLQADNVRYRVVDVASQLKTLIVEGRRGINPLEGSGAYLQHALAPPREPDPGKPQQTPPGAAGSSGSSSYVVPELISDLELGGKLLTDFRAMVLADVGQVSDAEAEQLKRFVEQGGTLLLFMGDAIDKENYNATLLPRHLLPGPLVKRVSVGRDQRGFVFDFKPHGVIHPLLNDFKDQENTGLDTAEVWAYWQADVPPVSNVERVLNFVPPEAKGSAGGAQTRGAGDPAITVQSVGQGRVVFVATTASPEWTTLPAKTNFPALMLSLLSGTVRTGDYWMNLAVGQPLVIPPAVRLASAPTLTDAAQRPVVVEAAADGRAGGAAAYRTAPLTRPGLYTLSLGDRSVPIAVNVPAADEADVRTIPDEQLREDLGGVDATLRGAEPPAAAAVAAGEGNDLSWWCMAAVLALVGVECFLAMRFGHYRRTEAPRAGARVNTGAGAPAGAPT